GRHRDARLRADAGFDRTLRRGAVSRPKGVATPATKVAAKTRPLPNCPLGASCGCFPAMTRSDGDVGPLVRATLALPADGMHRAVEWGGPLTPYVVEEILDDALHAGAGASLDLRVSGTTTDEWVARLRHMRERLCRRGIDVRLHRATLTAE